MKNFRQLERLIAGGVATAADFDGIAPAEVHRIKSELPYQARGVLIARAMPDMPMAPEDEPTLPAKPEDRIIRHVASVQLVDRMGDLLIANPEDAARWEGEAWVTRFWHSAGAPFLWQHWSDEPAIGVGGQESIEQIAVPLQDAPGGKAWALVIPVRYLADEAIPYSVPAYLLAQAGISGVSVGFLCRKSVWIDDPDERAELGLGPWGSLMVTCELLELSKAQLPANPWCVGAGKSAGLAEQRASSVLERAVRSGVLQRSLRDDYVKRFALGAGDAAARLEARVRSFVPQAKEVRGRPCVGLECLVPEEPAKGGILLNTPELRGVLGAYDHPETIMPMPGGKRIPARPATVTASAGPALVELASWVGCGCGQASKSAPEVADRAVPERSMRRVRSAFELGSALIEQLAAVVDDDDAEAPPEKSSGNLSYLADGLPPTLSPELRAALADPGSLAVLDHMARRMASSTTSRGGSRLSAPAEEAIEPSAGGDATRGRNAQPARDPAVDAALSALTAALAPRADTTT